MFRNQRIQRFIANTVLVTFSNLVMYPISAQAQAADAERIGLLQKLKSGGIIANNSTKQYPSSSVAQKSSPVRLGADGRVGQLLGDIHEHLKSIVPQTALPKNHQPPAANAVPADIASHVKSIRSKAAEVRGLYANIDQSFTDTEKRLKDAKVPQEILNRHKTAVAQYADRKARFERLMNKVELASDKGNAADQKVALADLGSFMTTYPNAKPHQYTDPNKLPSRLNGKKIRAPYTTKAQYQANLFPPTYEKLMLASLSLDGIKLVQATLPNVPNAADLAQTEDIQITQAIKKE